MTLKNVYKSMKEGREREHPLITHSNHNHNRLPFSTISPLHYHLQSFHSNYPTSLIKMKSSLIVAFISFLGATIASPVATPPTHDQVLNAIKAWRSDVVAVNGFLNNAPKQTGDVLKKNAQSTLNTANDEPNELEILAKVPGLDPVAMTAITTLKSIFGNVPGGLKNIIASPNDHSKVATQLQVINGARCCSVLPSLDILWKSAAKAANVQVDTSVPRANACTNGATIC